jgi:hypothetical protein
VSTSDAPDPLGRRSLFWATGTQPADTSSRGRKNPALGKLAFYSDATTASRRSERRPATDDVGNAIGQIPGDKSGKRGLPWVAAGLDSSAVLGSVTVVCSSCEETSDVGVGRFLALHLPFWVWRPGRGYARLMTCPACSKRTWLSASWRPWER